MTEEPYIRQACEEAEMPHEMLQGYPKDGYTRKLVEALARRIKAKREAGPVAWMIDDGPKLGKIFFNLPTSTLSGETIPVYTHPPKQPDQAARIAELEAALREARACKNCGFVPEKTG